MFGLLQTTLNETLAELPSGGVAELIALIDPAWIAQALCATGKASIRRRKLPAEQVVWLVIGPALFRQMPLWQVVQEMALTLDDQELSAPSASVQARQRLGAEPLEHLFGLLTEAWGRAHQVHQDTLRVLAVDGMVWSAPDSADNRQLLGSGKTQYGPQLWPMVRTVVCLLDARPGDYHCGELTLAADLRGLDHSITLFDRAYFSSAFLLDWHARLIQTNLYGKRRRFITSMLDHERFATQQLAQMYRQRWEIELGFREIKQSRQHGHSVLHSRQPELVMLEVWGVLIAHTLLRRCMRLMAQHAQVEPVRISLHTARHALVGMLRGGHLARARARSLSICSGCSRRLATSYCRHADSAAAMRARSSAPHAASTHQRKCQSGLN